MLGLRRIKSEDIISSKEVDKSIIKEWPFIVDKVIIQKRGILLADKTISDKMIYLTLLINGKVIGLNGASVDKYPIKSILDSKYYINGITVGDLIDYGFKM